MMMMKEIRETAREIGVKIIDDRSKHEWVTEWLMFADDTVLLDDDEKALQRLVNDFGRVCRKRKLTVNVEKSKVMKVSKNGDQNELNISLDGKRMEEVNAYRYLGVDVTNDGKMNEEVNHRVGEAKKVVGGLQKLWKKRCVSREAKVGMYEGIVESSLLYGSEVWGLNVHERK